MKYKCVRAVFENPESLQARDLEKSALFVGLLKIQVPLAIDHAVNKNKSSAIICEINDSGCFVEIHRKYWIKALETCLLLYIEEENYEICNKIKHLIQLIKTKKFSITN